VIATVIFIMATTVAPHLSRTTITVDRFVITAGLPDGWSVEDGEVQPPAALRSSCRVHGAIFSGRDWNRTLAAGLDPANVIRASNEHRELFRIGGHEAVRNEYTDSSGRTVVDIYINLTDLAPDTVALWHFDGAKTAEGRQCRIAFGFFIDSATFALRPPGATP
jgi:hypothetical protein